MSSNPITGVYNDGYIKEAYDAFRRDPASVDESWRQFFRFAESLGGAAPSTTPAPPTTAGQLDPAFLRDIAAAAELVDAIIFKSSRGGRGIDGESRKLLWWFPRNSGSSPRAPRLLLLFGSSTTRARRTATQPCSSKEQSRLSSDAR